MKISAVILAAGLGSRLQHRLPKPLIPILGKVCIRWIWDLLKECGIEDVITVIHEDNKDLFIEYSQDYQGVFAYQKNRDGTADAALCGLKLAKYQNALILNGDTPCIDKKDLINLFDNCFSLLAFYPEFLGSYGLIERIKNKAVCIHEQNHQIARGMANAGVYFIPVAWGLENLPLIEAKGDKNEKWLTELVAIAYKQKQAFTVVEVDKNWMCEGINTVKQWVGLELYLKKHISEKFINNSVYIQDADSISWSADTVIEKGASIGRGCIFDGNVLIKSGCVIEAYTTIKNSIIEKNVLIKSYSYIDNSHIHQNCVIGPFAHIQESVCDTSSVIGNYVEIKRSNLGKKNKIKHLAYLGDVVSKIGVNVGAGSIVCNYNGLEKYKTYFGKGVFIGSNTTIIAPCEIGDFAVVAAATVITKNIDTNKLTIGRIQNVSVDYKLCEHLKKRIDKME